MTDRFNLREKALKLVDEMHATEIRKAMPTPSTIWYGYHLLEAAAMVGNAGGSEEAVAAALLHDGPENHGNGWYRTIERECGKYVADLVRECQEEGTGDGPKLPWRTRKQSELKRVATVSAEALLIRVAEKLEAERQLWRSVQLHGDRTYAKFNAPKADIHWYHQALYQAYCSAWATIASQEPFWSVLRLYIDEFGGLVSNMQKQTEEERC